MNKFHFLAGFLFCCCFCMPLLAANPSLEQIERKNIDQYQSEFGTYFLKNRQNNKDLLNLLSFIVDKNELKGRRGPQGIAGATGPRGPAGSDAFFRDNGQTLTFNFVYSDGSIIQSGDSFYTFVIDPEWPGINE